MATLTAWKFDTPDGAEQAVATLKRDLMTQLTETQLLILSKAAQRQYHAIELPPNLKGGAANKVVAKLINGGLAMEVAGNRGDTVEQCVRHSEWP